jgi:hypothetical protein
VRERLQQHLHEDLARSTRLLNTARQPAAGITVALFDIEHT